VDDLYNDRKMFNIVVIYLSLSSAMICSVGQWYGDSVDNTVEENSSISSLIRMRWLLSARACEQ